MSPRFVLISLSAVLAPMLAGAQSQSGSVGSSWNMMTLGLVSLMIILLLTIALLGVVLRHLSETYSEQLKRQRTASAVKRAALLPPVLFFSMLAQAQGVPASESALLSAMPMFDFYAIMGVIGLELLVVFGMLFSINRLVQVIRNAPEKETALDRLYQRNFWDLFHKSVAVAEEKDIMLDHDYDGIKELDNSLPPWWKWGFAFTIVFSVGYMYYFHLADGPSSAQEYIASVEKAERAQAEYLAKSGNKIDETNLQPVTDASTLENAKTVFTNVCAPCHAADGGGTVGPNLTDAYWLHGGSLVDVFKSIKYGWKDKGMPEWQTNLSPKQIASLASYVQSLKGKRTVAPKEPQGVLYVGADSDTSEENVADSTSRAPSGQVSNERQIQQPAAQRVQVSRKAESAPKKEA